MSPMSMDSGLRMKRSIAAIVSTLKSYRQLSREYPEIENRVELAIERALGRFPRRLRARFRDSTVEFASCGSIPLLYIYQEIYRDLCYLPPHWDAEECFGPGKTVLDIGANIGLFAIFAARQGCSVYAIEPNPSNYCYLLENVRLNSLATIYSQNFAFSNVDGCGELFVAEQPSGSSLVRSQSVGSRFSVPVKTRRLESFLAEILEPHIDLLKIDCEGGEYDILLNSGPETLERICRVSMEFHNGVNSHTSADIVSHLSRNGFSVEVKESTPSFGFIWAHR